MTQHISDPVSQLMADGDVYAFELGEWETDEDAIDQMVHDWMLDQISDRRIVTTRLERSYLGIPEEAADHLPKAVAR